MGAIGQHVRVITIQRCVALAVAAAFVLSACGGDGSSASAFCDQMKSFRSKYVKDANKVTQDQIDQASAELAAMAKRAPKAVRTDAESVSDAFEIYAAGKTPPAYRSKEFETASANLTAYAEKHCGIDLSTPTT